MIIRFLQKLAFFSKKEKNSAIVWVKSNKKKIIEKFAKNSKCTACEKNEPPISLFMAGSPGAGKTETAKSFQEILGGNVVHIDADEIKKIIPHYNGANSQTFQPASALAVEKLYDHVLREKKNIILDTTFAHINIARKNIKRSLDKKRIVVIVYVYQDKDVAWNFTKMREKSEGRYVPRKVFLHAFREAGKNVLSIKQEFENEVNVLVVKKDFQKNFEDFKINIGTKELDKIIENIYNK